MFVECEGMIILAGEKKEMQSIDQYTYPEKKRLNNPPVGLVTPGTDQDAPKKKYQYDPHLDPRLDWAGKAEYTSFEVDTVSFHVHERIDPLTIIAGVRKQADQPEEEHHQMSLFEKVANYRPLREAIKGNPLTIQQVEETIEKKIVKNKGEQEVRNYWDALNYLSRARNRNLPVSEEFIRKLHAIIEVRGPGRRGGKSNYRGPMPPGYLFAVWDKETGQPDYIPPSHEDVAVLMRELIGWFNSREAKELPVPIKAAIFACQLVTIHPFEDGNGRTARAMANYILMRQGYDLRGFYSVEEHYAADLASYYSNLQMCLPVNYYDGRNDPELSPWLLFFLESMYKAYQDVVNLTRSFTESAKVKLAGLGEKDKRLLLLALQFQKPLIPVTIANWFGLILKQFTTGLRTGLELDYLSLHLGV